MTVKSIVPIRAIEKQFWTWRNHRIAFTASGEGSPLLLIHGFGASIGHWRNNIPAFADAGYRVYALDLLGFGDSDKPALEYSLELWRDLIADFWTEFIKEPTVFAGNSIGALLALMLAAEYPDRTEGIVLLNCAGGLNHRPEELNLPLRMVMGTFAKLVSSKWFGSFLFDRVRQPHRIRGTLRQVYGNREAVTDELVEMLYAPSCHPGAQQVFASILTAPAGPKPSELLPQVQCPMLVLWGEDDPWTPVKGSQIFQDWGKRHPVTFHSIPKTGHCPHDERPEIVNSLVLDWLGDRERF
ncbi:alpha/beta fold hydrolase [Baaleninema simplex]|uniref:alpha/beta fold hydrolase n=1 Tax=Baaleninema simplex TaxID=2862350 RepID=UPI00034B24D4|nr:alpha/beta fold hydrolase [Baaleninema simplex]